MLSSLPVLLAAAGCSPRVTSTPSTSDSADIPALFTSTSTATAGTDSSVTTPDPWDTGVPGGQFLVATGDPPAPPAPPAQVAGETSWCWYLDFVDADTTGLYVAGMDSGTIVEIARYPLSPVFTQGMTWTGHAFVAANGTYGYLELYLDGRYVNASDHRAYGGLAWLNGAGMVANYAWEALPVYASFDDLVADRPIGAVPMTPLFGPESYDLDGDTLYGAGRGDDHLDEYDVTTGDPTRTIPLEGFDAAVSGPSYAGGFLHVADDGRTEPQFLPRIARFDLDGHAVSDVYMSSREASPNGLWCDAPR